MPDPDNWDGVVSSRMPNFGAKLSLEQDFTLDEREREKKIIQLPAH